MKALSRYLGREPTATANRALDSYRFRCWFGKHSNLQPDRYAVLRALCVSMVQGGSLLTASQQARQAHNLKVIGSNPIPATKFQALENASFSRAFCCSQSGSKFRAWKRRGTQEESRSVKSARAEEGRDNSIVIAGRWRAPQLVSDHGSRGPFTILLCRRRCLTGELRIWGSGVRISSGAPFISSTYESSPFESERLKRFFNRWIFWGPGLARIRAQSSKVRPTTLVQSATAYGPYREFESQSLRQLGRSMHSLRKLVGN